MRPSTFMVVATVLLLGRKTSAECFGDVAVGTTTWSSEGEDLSVVFATISNTGEELIKVPYDVAIYNPLYRSVEVFWNFNVTLVSEGKVVGTVYDEWADLLPISSNAINIGFIVGHDSTQDLNQTVPIELMVADEVCILESIRV